MLARQLVPLKTDGVLSKLAQPLLKLLNSNSADAPCLFSTFVSAQQTPTHKQFTFKWGADPASVSAVCSSRNLSHQLTELSPLAPVLPLALSGRSFHTKGCASIRSWDV